MSLSGPILKSLLGDIPLGNSDWDIVPTIFKKPFPESDNNEGPLLSNYHSRYSARNFKTHCINLARLNPEEVEELCLHFGLIPETEVSLPKNLFYQTPAFKDGLCKWIKKEPELAEICAEDPDEHKDWYSLAQKENRKTNHALPSTG